MQIEFNHYMSIRLSTHQAVMILHILGYGSGDKTAIFKVRCGSGVAANVSPNPPCLIRN
jgi:hypothetical protein